MGCWILGIGQVIKNNYWVLGKFSLRADFLILWQNCLFVACWTYFSMFILVTYATFKAEMVVMSGHSTHINLDCFWTFSHHHFDVEITLLTLPNRTTIAGWVSVNSKNFHFGSIFFIKTLLSHFRWHLSEKYLIQNWFFFFAKSKLWLDCSESIVLNRLFWIDSYRFQNFLFLKQDKRKNSQNREIKRTPTTPLNPAIEPHGSVEVVPTFLFWPS